MKKTKKISKVCPNWAFFQNGKADEIILSEEEIKEMKSKILKDLQFQCKKADFSQHATVKDIIIEKENWTPENGCLTASLKMKRRNIIAKHVKEINELLKKLE